MKKFFLSIVDNILTIKFFLKLKIFKSSMGEIKSLFYKLHHLNSQKSFLFKGLKNKEYYVKAKNFNNYGFTTFSNKIIQKNSELILSKINSSNNQWHKNGTLKWEPTNKFKGEIIEMFNNGIDEFLKSVFKSDYCIFDHFVFKSERKSVEEVPINSQLWHADGYPGIGLNLLISHTPINKYNGSIKIIKWETSIKLLTKLFLDYKHFVRKTNLGPINPENRMEYRKAKCEILKTYIGKYNIKYFQPESDISGTVIAFSNNCVHAGGYTDFGQKRIVSLFHIYPSAIKRTLEEKLNFCTSKKSGAYPKLRELESI